MAHSDEKLPTVLIAEDEALLRLTGALIFSKAGLHPIEAVSADHALELLRGATVHLLFTDIHMPGTMDGLALAHHVAAHWPRIAILIASGRRFLSPSEMPAGARFHRKPYDHGLLIQQALVLVAARPQAI
jgi:CheY-like chemotaxis protein